MRRRTVIDIIRLAAVSLSLMFSGCVTAGAEASIEVSGQSFEKNVERARRFVTPMKNQQLRRDVHVAFPDIPERSLDGLYLNWRVTSIKSLTGGATERRVALVVGVRYRPSTIDAERVLDYCERSLRDELGRDAQID